MGLKAAEHVQELIPLMGDRVVVLHGPQKEEGLSGRDIDCIVEGLDRRWPLRMATGWRLCQWFRYDLRAWFWWLEREGEYVAVDTTDDPDGIGRDALRTHAFLAEPRGEPGALVQAAYLTVKRVRKRMFDSAEWARIGEVATTDPAGFAAELERIAGPSIAGVLAPVALSGTPPTPAVVRSVHRRRWIRRFGSPTRIVRAASQGAQRYSERIANPPGLSILVVGPDGAGKSTLAERLPDACAPMFRRHAHSHWRPGILPRPGALIGRTTGDSTRPHERTPFGRPSSIAFAGYYWLDFLVGGVLLEAPMKIRSGLAVCERGWWDLAVDPARYRLEIAPWVVRAMGRLLPYPDLVLVLEADPTLLHARKPELEVDELRRQTVAWKSSLPPRIRSVRLDASHSPGDVLSEATEAVTELMEVRAVSRLDSGWATLPPGTERWWLPRGPRAVAAASVAVYQPVTPRALFAWTLARALAAWGSFRLLPRGTAPPLAVRRALAPHVPARGTFALARANHRDRFFALLLDADGNARSVAKVAMDEEGKGALRREADALRRVEVGLAHGLVAPRVLHEDDGLLLLESIAWLPRAQPWVLDERVAAALGAFFRSGRRPLGNGWIGPAHGDCAPWNLLRTSRGWALVDWESAGEEPAFHDVCHYIVQSHALLGRPTSSELLEGFRDRRGAVADALLAYARDADVSVEDAGDAFVSYLRRAVREQTAGARGEWRGMERRVRLLERMEA